MAATAKRVSSPRLVAVKAPRNVRAPRKAPEPIDPKDLGVVEQVKACLKPGKRLATLLGALLGGVAPLISYVIAHYELDANVPLYSQMATLLVAGCLLFSASSVYNWGRNAFQSSVKALGFVILTEGTLVFAHTHWLGLVGLVYLIAINAISTGCVLALGKLNR